MDGNFNTRSIKAAIMRYDRKLAEWVTGAEFSKVRVSLSLILFFAVFFISAGTSAGTAAAAQSSAQGEVLKVAFPEMPGLNEINEDGTIGGITYEFLLEIAKYTGWEYEFVTGNDGDMLEGMIAGEYDLMGGMFYDEGYGEIFNYPDYIMGNSNSLLIYKNDHPVIRTFDLTTLDGMRIGVYEQAENKIGRLRNFLDFNGLKCEIITYEEYEEYLKCLENDSVDVMLGNNTNLNGGLSVVAQFEAEPYYLVTSKRRSDICVKLNKAMKGIYAANPNFAKELEDKYYIKEYTSPIVFTKEDIEFIKEAGQVRVAVIEKRAPIYYASNGEDCGIVVDLCSLIKEKTGLEFTFVVCRTYQDAINAVKDGKADVMGGYMDDFYEAERDGLSLVKSYASLDSVILKNKRTSYPAANLVMAVPEGREAEAEQESRIKYYRNYEECLAAVNAGEADFFRIPSAFLERLYRQNIYSNVVVIATDNMQTKLSLALAKPVNVKLYSVLSKAVNNLSEQEKYELIVNNLVSSGEFTVSFKSLVYSHPAAFVVCVVGLLGLVLGIVILIMNFRVKNKIMEVKIEKAEETAKAKADFLSRMSHEIRTPMNAIIGLTNLTQISCELSGEVRQNLEKIDASARFLLSLVNDVLDMSKIDSDKMAIEEKAFDLDKLLSQIQSIFELQAKENSLTLIISKKYDASYYIGDEIRIKQVLTNLLANACKFTDRGGTVEFSVTQTQSDETGISLLFSVKDSGMGIEPMDLERIFESFEQGTNRVYNGQGTGLGLSISKKLVSLMGGKLEVSSSLGEGSRFFFTLRLPVSQEAPVYTENMAAAGISLKGINILLAEDNELNAEITTAILELKDAVVEHVVNGQEAVERFMEKPEKWFDVILMDLQMPVKNGFEATKEIRLSNRADAATVPIIAMTANTFKEDWEHAFAAGMTGFVPKPFNIETLYAALGEALADDTVTNAVLRK